MRYFYTVQNPWGRVGYGIAGDYKEQNQDYIAGLGELSQFPVVFGGTPHHVTGLEKHIKRKRLSDTWTVRTLKGDWYTEWFEREVPLEGFIEYVKDTIEFMRYSLEVVDENYCFGHIK